MSRIKTAVLAALLTLGFAGAAYAGCCDGGDCCTKSCCNKRSR